MGKPCAPPLTNGSAIVVGASLACLMASLALVRVGLRVTLVERGSAQPRSGAVLQLDSGDVDQSATAQALRQLANGRVALVGDAGHVLTPLTAAGFNASLQDAASLADCVAQRVWGAGAAAALRDYEARRLPIVRRLVQGGQSFSRSFGR